MASVPSTPATLPVQSAEQVMERIEAALRASPDGVLAFDGDGTLWDGDVGEDFFHALVAHNDFREPAMRQMEHEARTHDVALGGDGKALAGRIYDAYLAGRFPEEPVCELMTWCCAGWTASEVDAFAADVIARGSLAARLHPEVLRVIAWARGRGAEVFLVSASARPIIEHAGRAVGFDDDHIIAAVPRYEDERMVADVVRPIPYAAGKVHNLRARIGATRTLAAAFGDNAFDVAMLAQASVPVAVRPKLRLRDRAADVQMLVEIARES
jgi:HAD superfamily phosphoserine phosphatase-like hydrolase